MSKICALQLGTLSMSYARIDYYLKLAKERGADIIAIGEYVLNSFFTELIKMPSSMIREQSEHQRKIFQILAEKYDLTIIAPIILYKNKNLYKVVAKFAPNSTKYDEQSILIAYPHWNERKFFQNSPSEPNFMTFTHDKFKFAVIFGFEAHFDDVWKKIMGKKIDCVIIPTACTLSSKERWNELLKMRAFTNNLYILRVNRLGKAKFGDVVSEFYGNSMIISPHGEILDSLDENEGLLICELDKELLHLARNLWKFRDIVEKFSKTDKILQ